VIAGHHDPIPTIEESPGDGVRASSVSAVGETREERRNWRGALDRAEWLARPWFFFSVALLALNDHVFKHAFPGWVTGSAGHDGHVIPAS
jgi:hypothetical protein